MSFVDVYQFVYVFPSFCFGGGVLNLIVLIPDQFTLKQCHDQTAQTICYQGERFSTNISDVLSEDKDVG